MSSEGSTFNTEITANPAKFEEGFKKAVSVAATSSDQINAQFKKIGDAVSRVNNMLLGFTAVLAGGGALKKFISDANEWNASAGKMAAQLGISTEKASVLNTALSRLGIDTDTYLGAAQKLSKQVQSNGQAFEVLGVNVRDTSGAYKPVVDLMGEVNAKLIAIKNPIEQNIAGQQVYGKGWAEVRAVLRVTGEQMAQAEQRARELGLIVGPEGVAQSKQYSQQMRDLGLVGKSLEIQFGNALLPIFTRVGYFMAQEGPKMGEVFAYALNKVAFAASATWLALKDMGDGLGALMAQGAALIAGDMAAFKAIGRERDEQAAKNEAAYERMKKLYDNPVKQIGLPEDPNINANSPQYSYGKEGKGAAVAAPSRMGDWEAQLAEQKAALEKQGMAEGQYREMSKAAQISYWEQLKSLQNLSRDERIAIARKVAELEMASVKEAFEVKVKTLQAESEAYKHNFDEKLRIERQIQAMYQAGTKEYEESQKRVVAIQREAAAQARQVAQAKADAERQALLSVLALEEQTLKQAEQLGLVSKAQLLTQAEQFENRRTEILMAALVARKQAELAGGDGDPVKVAQVQAEIEALEQGHQQRLAQIKGAMQANELEPLVNTYQAGEQALAKAINGVLSRTQSLGQAMKSIWQGISSSIIGEISKILAKKAAAWATERLLALAGIGAKGAEAGASAAAAMAGIPYVGPILALAAQASVMASVMGAKGSVPSAYAGYDIPVGLNPMTQLHEKEMVLPAKHADVIRSLSESGQASAQSSAGSIHLTVTAMDAKGVKDFLVDNHVAVAAAVRAAVRNNSLMVTR